MVVSRKTGHYRNAVLVPAANHRRQLIPTVRYPQMWSGASERGRGRGERGSAVPTANREYCRAREEIDYAALQEIRWRWCFVG